MATREQLADEAARAQKVRHLVDLATSLIMQSGMTRRDAETLVQTVRERILSLFPDGEHTYELIYAPRFKRLIDEFAHANPRAQGVVISFPTRRR
ncbi:MAG TPA: hypothetical protein VGQ10_17920 [Vicinamibacterales bacterium]|nr:hypothetical protein [Vicinamibacterales bacterium]